MNEKSIKILSVVATITAVCMYVAYIPQIQANLAGAKGSPWQPLAAAVHAVGGIRHVFKTAQLADYRCQRTWRGTGHCGILYQPVNA